MIQSDPEVVHTNNLIGMTAAVWAAASELQKPIVHTVRDFHLLCPRTTLLRSDGSLCERPRWPCRVLSHFKLRASRHVSVVTSPSRYCLERHLAGGGFAGARSAVIPNACETLPESVPGRSGRTKVQGLYLGALASHKGIPELIAALRRLFQDPDSHRLHFALAGEGDEREPVEALCREHPDRCRYLGVITGDAKTAVLNESDFVIAPSIWPEIFGRVILDGFSHGLPVIGANRGGIPEVIRDGQDGQIIEPSPANIAAAISIYIRDDQIRLEHGRAAFARARDFSAAKQMGRFEAVYRDL
jgi:glycosyltransferase involved in cell wall biosynthesis